MYIITAWRMVSGEVLKYLNGLRIKKRHETSDLCSSRSSSDTASGDVAKPGLDAQAKVPLNLPIERRGCSALGAQKEHLDRNQTNRGKRGQQDWRERELGAERKLRIAEIKGAQTNPRATKHNDRS